jgi:homoserine O-acetyltransferase
MKNVHRFEKAVLIVASLLGMAASLAAQEAPGAPQYVELGDFKLTSGAVIHDLRLRYRTFGKLNADKSNAILWPTWLGGRTEDLLHYVGAGKVIDDREYFVILVDAIGNGVSTSPSNSNTQKGIDFPRFTIRDMVESERRLLTEVFHVEHLRAVMGISMGGMQTFEWIAAYPDFMDTAIPIVGSPQSTSYDKLLWTAENDAVALDPAWNHGHPTGPLGPGLVMMQEIGALNSTSPEYRVAHTKPKEFADFIGTMKKATGGDPLRAIDGIRQREAIMDLDVAAEFGGTLETAAARVHAKLLVIVSQQDHVVNPTPAIEFARLLHAPVVLMDSPCGHNSPGCVSVGPIVAQFLTNPSSVQSVTLRDTANSPH